MRKIRILALIIFSFTLSVMPAQASLIAVKSYLPEPQLVGKARLKMMFWNIFDAKLFSETGQFDPDKPFALALTYLRNFSDHDIVDRTIGEIRSQNPSLDKNISDQWKSQLNKIIPDVSRGSSITGVRTVKGYTQFYLDNTAIGDIEDPAFTKAFFDIWLGEKSSNRVLRNKLIGVGST